jgi:hypothetical protein
MKLSEFRRSLEFKEGTTEPEREAQTQTQTAAHTADANSDADTRG